jgi:malonyl-CoA O-methyltransferase
MHDVGDALLRTRFAEPVMDVERLTVTYPDVWRLMRELKQIGAHNVTAGRPRGLTGKTRMQRVVRAYEAFRREGVLPASYEIVNGHAWAAAGGKTVNLPVDQLRRL